MDPLTHLLTGATLARAGFNHKTALATATMTIAADIPDIDILAQFKGSATGFIEHRGITHTFIGIPVVAALALAIVWLVDALWQRLRRKRSPQTRQARRWGLLYLFACIAGYSHILLDFLGNYGVRPFYPFSDRWYSWDIVFIIEPLMLVALIAALVLPSLFGAVDQEIGARQYGPRGRGAAIAALLFIIALWGVRDFEHRRALAALEAFDFHGEPSVRVAAYPYMVNPFRWAGVAETRTAYISTEVDSRRPEVDPGNNAQTYYKPENTRVTEAARTSDLGRFYVQWARFPLVVAEHLTEPVPADLVRFADVRFLYPGERRRPLQAYVLLDSNLHVESEGFETIKDIGGGRKREVTRH